MRQRFKTQLMRVMMQMNTTTYDEVHEREFEDFEEFLKEFEAK